MSRECTLRGGEERSPSRAVCTWQVCKLHNIAHKIPLRMNLLHEGPFLLLVLLAGCLKFLALAFQHRHQATPKWEIFRGVIITASIMMTVTHTKANFYTLCNAAIAEWLPCALNMLLYMRGEFASIVTLRSHTG